MNSVGMDPGRKDQELTLRPILHADAEFLAKLCGLPRVREALSLGNHGRDYWTRAVRAWTEDPDEGAFIVCRGRPLQDIGWIAVNGLQSVSGTAWIKMMALLPELWHHGYCRVCVRMVKDTLQDRGFKRLRLWTDVANTRAISCYQASGFRRIMEERRLVGDPPEERLRVLMECRLD
jgi:RimJ/RimL family protein N-acetyltransferase